MDQHPQQRKTGSAHCYLRISYGDLGLPQQVWSEFAKNQVKMKIIE